MHFLQHKIVYSMVILSETSGDTDTIGEFTEFVNSEFKWILYGTLCIFLVTTAIKRAWIKALTVIIGFGLFALLAGDTDIFYKLAEKIAGLFVSG